MKRLIGIRNSATTIDDFNNKKNIEILINFIVRGRTVKKITLLKRSICKL